MKNYKKLQIIFSSVFLFFALSSNNLRGNNEKEFSLETVRSVLKFYLEDNKWQFKQIDLGKNIPKNEMENFIQFGMSVSKSMKKSEGFYLMNWFDGESGGVRIAPIKTGLVEINILGLSGVFREDDFEKRFKP